MWPQTHLSEAHATIQASPSTLRTWPSVQMDLSSGSCVVMDSRLYHCGGGNVADTPRCLLVVSFARAADALPRGSTYSLLPELAGRHTLRSLRSMNGTAGREVGKHAFDQEGEGEGEGEEEEEEEEDDDDEEEVGGEEEEDAEISDESDEPAEPMASMPVGAVKQLAHLAQTLPWQREPRARQVIAPASFPCPFSCPHDAYAYASASVPTGATHTP